MTFDNAPLAIDGAKLKSSLLRRGTFSGTNGASGIVNKADLKVTQLGTPGVGVLIAAGAGVVVNDYQTVPNESYVVSNPTAHTIPSGSMPVSSTSAQSFIVAVVIGDPDFSQTGHPFMGADDPPAGQEETFTYVRPILIQVANNTVTTLNVDYPALVLARIDRPANTTTILNSHITDLRKLANPRQSQQIFVSPGGTWNNTTPRRIAAGAAYADWGAQEYAPTVAVPPWATRAIVVTNVNGVRLADTSANVSGGVRTQLGTVAGQATSFDYAIGGGAIRDNLQTASSYDVSGIAGTTVALRVEGFENVPASPSNNQKLALQAGSQQIFDVRFFEE